MESKGFHSILGTAFQKSGLCQKVGGLLYKVASRRSLKVFKETRDSALAAMFKEDAEEPAQFQECLRDGRLPSMASPVQRALALQPSSPALSPGRP